MVGKKTKGTDQAIVEIQFEEYLTSCSCSKVVVEIIKYLAYQKQQIPYPFEQLKLLVDKNKVTSEEISNEKAVKRRCLQLERHHSKASDAVDTLENIFKNIEAEFLTSEEDGIGRVEEVVILFGATPVTPKDVFRIQLPPVKSHTVFDTPRLPSRKTMVQLLRCLLESEGLNSIISQPIAPTNAFVFFKRKAASDKLSTIPGGSKRWFLPRENFRLTQKGRQAVLKIECLPQLPEVNLDSPLAHPLGDVSDLEQEISNSLMESPVVQECPQLGSLAENGHAKVLRDPDSRSAMNLFSTHLVFKPVPLKQEICGGISADRAKTVSNQVQNLVNEVLDSIDDLNKPLQELRLDSSRTENSSMEVNYIEWFEARVTLKGFKDYIVNGVSAINA